MNTLLLTVQRSVHRALRVRRNSLRRKNENVSSVSHPSISGVNPSSKRKSACVVLLSSENISVDQKGPESIP
jgi:hypothetical protein